MPICCTSSSQSRERPQRHRRHCRRRRHPATGLGRMIAFLHALQSLPSTPSVPSTVCSVCSVTSLRSPPLRCWYTLSSPQSSCRHRLGLIRRGCFWHKADMPITLSDVRFRGYKADVHSAQSSIPWAQTIKFIRVRTAAIWRPLPVELDFATLVASGRLTIESGPLWRDRGCDAHPRDVGSPVWRQEPEE